MIGLRLCAAMLGAAITFAPAAFADKNAEKYVATQANVVLRLLSDTTISDAARADRFHETLNSFAYLPDIARRVLGVRGRELDQATLDRYCTTFEQYAAAVYQRRFNEMHGSAIAITGSTDPAPRRSLVSTLVKRGDSDSETRVIWDVLMSKDGTTYRIRDVAIDLNGSVLWLAQDQQAQFEAYLDRHDGDINMLIKQLEQKTAAINAGIKVSTSNLSNLDGGAVD